MTTIGWLQIIFYFVVLILLVKPLGWYMAKVYQGERTFMSPLIAPVERFIYRLAGVDPATEMDWKVYAVAVLLFSVAGFIFLYLLQRLQGVLPLNPMSMGGGNTRPVSQYGSQLYHQHQLAELRRRDHFKLSDTDGRSYRPEFRFRCRWHGYPGCIHPRLYPP